VEARIAHILTANGGDGAGTRVIAAR